MIIPEPRKLKSGKWFIQLRLGGESISITEVSAIECEKKARLAKAEYQNGDRVSKPKKANPLTLAKTYEQYIAVKTGVLSPSTIAGYYHLSKNTMQGLMEMPISAITSADIQAQVSEMAIAGKSRKYIANSVGLLSAVMSMYRPEFAVRVQLPQKQKQEMRRISDDEISAIIGIIKGAEIELPVLMALWLGMRMSEIRGAQYGDIKGDRLHIQRAVVLDSERKDAEKPPKTFSGDRWVNLPPYIKSLIGNGEATDKIVTLSAQTIFKRLTKMCEQNGIEHFRFHDLRHANAAVMARLGIDSKYAQERNGWSSDRMYKQVYAYTMDDKMQIVDNAINNYFANKMLTSSETQ